MTIAPPSPSRVLPRSKIARRDLLLGLGAGAAGIACGGGLATAYAQIVGAADYTLRIAPLRLESSRPTRSSTRSATTAPSRAR